VVDKLSRRFEYLFVKVIAVKVCCVVYWPFDNVVGGGEVVVSAMERSVGEECLGIYICMNRRVFAC